MFTDKIILSVVGIVILLLLLLLRVQLCMAC